MSLENEIFAIASRIHVGLRRKKNRIIDIEYLMQSPQYGQEVIRLARASADSDLNEMATKLEAYLFSARGLFPKKPTTENQLAPTRASAAPAIGQRLLQSLAEKNEMRHADALAANSEAQYVFSLR